MKEEATLPASEQSCEAENILSIATNAQPRIPSIASSSSMSLHSTTSTLEYEQEAFEQYQQRVRKLCHLLWPTLPQVGLRRNSTSSVGTKARILEAVMGSKWRRSQSNASQTEYTIERLNGGTYNRIVGIKISEARTKESKDVILRVPRANMAAFSHVQREVATMRFVRRKTALPVADIVSFDPTDSNPLKDSYVIQSRLKGVALHNVWHDLKHEQRYSITKEVGKIMLSLQEVKHAFPGLIEASLELNGDLIVRPFDIVSPHDIDWKQKISRAASNAEVDTTIKGPLQWFGTQFGRWFANELHEDPSAILYWDYQYRFVKVAKQMNALGFLGDGQNCLCHFDLAAHNILVKFSSDGSPVISGIVDWDSAVFAPTFASCAPPTWLWTEPAEYDAEEGEENATPLTKEQEDIKEIFDDTVGFDWTWLAYQPGYGLARELFQFAQHGLPDGMASTRADRMLKEWEVLYDTLMNPEDENENDEDEDYNLQEAADVDSGPDKETEETP